MFSCLLIIPSLRCFSLFFCPSRFSSYSFFSSTFRFPLFLFLAIILIIHFYFLNSILFFFTLSLVSLSLVRCFSLLLSLLLHYLSIAFSSSFSFLSCSPLFLLLVSCCRTFACFLSIAFRFITFYFLLFMTSLDLFLSLLPYCRQSFVLFFFLLSRVHLFLLSFLPLPFLLIPY